MRGIWFFFITNILLLFPVYLNINAVVSQKKVYYSVTFYGLPVLGGYLNNKGVKLYLHISDNKAVLLDLYDYLKKNKGLISLKGMVLTEFSAITVIGERSKSVQTVCSLYPLSVVGCFVAANYLPYATIKSDLLLIEGGSDCVLELRFGVVFNLFTLVNIVIRFFINKAVELWKKRKKQKTS